MTNFDYLACAVNGDVTRYPRTIEIRFQAHCGTSGTGDCTPSWGVIDVALLKGDFE